MNSTKNFFALAAALLIPVVTDGALIAEAAKAIPEALLADGCFSRFIQNYLCLTTF